MFRKTSFQIGLLFHYTSLPRLQFWGRRFVLWKLKWRRHCCTMENWTTGLTIMSLSLFSPGRGLGRFYALLEWPHVSEGEPATWATPCSHRKLPQTPVVEIFANNDPAPALDYLPLKFYLHGPGWDMGQGCLWLTVSVIPLPVLCHGELQLVASMGFPQADSIDCV